MGLLQKLKSALGLDASGSPSAGTSTPQDVDVTVEREPSTESEDAVKGTETSGEPSEGTPESEAPAVEAETAEVSNDEEPKSGTDDDADGEEAVETVDDVASSDDDPPVTEVNGIGPAYAERLEEAGISTVSELAAADAEELGEATDLSPNRISGWIEQANSF